MEISNLIAKNNSLDTLIRGMLAALNLVQTVSFWRRAMQMASSGFGIGRVEGTTGQWRCTTTS